MVCEGRKMDGRGNRGERQGEGKDVRGGAGRCLVPA